MKFTRAKKNCNNIYITAKKKTKRVDKNFEIQPTCFKGQNSRNLLQRGFNKRRAKCMDGKKSEQ